MKNRERERQIEFDREYLERKKAWHARRAKTVAIQKGVIMAVVICAVLLFTLIVLGMRQNANASEAGYKAEQYFANVTVVSGDTLWKIAEAYTDGSTGQIRSCVEEIRSINSLGLYESIRPGDKLIVPYYVYKEVD